MGEGGPTLTLNFEEPEKMFGEALKGMGEAMEHRISTELTRRA